MLSIVDIKQELGKNILIYPLTISSIKANSIDLHASEFAWSIATKRSLFDGDKKIVVPPHDTALIYSKEAIYVSNKIGGTYHSKVTLASRGFGHIGTTLDAQYIGLSLIAFHNITDSPKEIIVGDEFVTVTFYYLHSEDYSETISHDNSPGHPSLLNDFEKINEYRHWEENNRWCRNKSELTMHMLNSNEYKECQKIFQSERALFDKKAQKKIKQKRILKYLISVFSWLLVNGILIFFTYLFKVQILSEICTFTLEHISAPLIVSWIIPNIVVDLQNNRRSD